MRTGRLLVTLLLIVIVCYAGYPYIDSAYRWFEKPKINSGYTCLVMSGSLHRIDYDGALLFADVFGCPVRYYPEQVSDTNQPTQFLIEIGFVTSDVPFIYRLYNTKEGIHPDVFWSNRTREMVGLLYSYPCSDSNDHGLIARMYNSDLRRWVIFILGYSGFCSYSGCLLLANEPSLMSTYEYVIFKYSGSHSTGYVPMLNDITIVEKG